MNTGFPSSLTESVETVLATLGTPAHPTTDWGELTVDGETISVPHRTYYLDPPDHRFRELDDLEQLIARCLLSRHHDGRVRERQVEPLLQVGLPWVGAYVLTLLGDYVLEIHQRLEPAFGEALRPIDRRRAMYLDLVANNPRFWQRTRSRITSYWNAYHRSRFPDIEDHPAWRVVRALEG